MVETCQPISILTTVSDLYINFAGLLCCNISGRVYNILGVNEAGQWLVQQL